MGRRKGPIRLRFSTLEDQNNCVYLAEFSNGVVKVGFTNSPRNRLARIEWSLRHRGIHIARFQVFAGRQTCGVTVDPQGRELKAIQALHRVTTPIVGHREYFDSITYDAALVVVRAALEV